MAKKLLMRRDYASAWNASNPVLEAGELALEIDTGNLKLGDGLTAWGDLDFYITRPTLGSLPMPEGSVRLELIGNLLSLTPYMGDLLYCRERGETLLVPHTLSTVGLTANTTYYIYATLVSKQWVLSASRAGFVFDRGVAVCSSDVGLTLVGMARTTALNTWEDSLTKRYVLSWYNRRMKKLQTKLPANVSLQDTSWVELDVDARVELLSWADYYGGEISASIMGTGTTANTATNMLTGIRYDGQTLTGATGSTPRTATTSVCPIAAYSAIPNVSEGYHQLGISCKISGTVAAATWFGGFSQSEGVVLEATTFG
jgi:Major tropism determinant N-terminal domain